MDYLRERQEYVDLYDLLTVKRCLRTINFWRDTFKKHSKDKELKGLTEEEKIEDFNKMLGMELYFTKIKEYERKEKTISEWVENDRVKQDKLDNTSRPRGVLCSKCNIEMKYITKHLEDYDNKPMRVLFFFECPKCKKRKGVYDNGKEYVSKPQLCKKCKKKFEVTHKKKGSVIIWTYKCKYCGHKEVEVDDFEKSHAKWEKEKLADKILLEKYRNEFCLSDKKGKEGIELLEALEVARVVKEEEAQKYGSSVYQRVMQLKKTTIVELEKMLNKVLKKNKYIKLTLEKPEIGQYVIVPFSVQDADSSRKGSKSSDNLEKIIKDTLKDTNWRLMDNYVLYRLGYLEGRLKGYEQEEDMMKLAGKEEKKEPKYKVSPEKRNKYEFHHMVQLARLVGQHEGIENLRKKRLEKEPEGFFLDESESTYSCGICGESTPGDKIWWNLDGLRCKDCWRNIKEGNIPPLKSRDDKVWLNDSSLSYNYSLHPSTRRKLVREGFLKRRELKRDNGSVYCTVYLVKENKEFFKKYPKKPKMKVTFVDSQHSE
ncbi:hypothetical protein JXA63_03785 [Candidatus Woesebacteria bacterium]|nr:hypothetical protein [Candidatus Woesebacteria bacterium]